MSVAFTVLPQDTLAQPIDSAARLALYAPGSTVKGLFFSRLVAIVGKEAVARMRSELQMPGPYYAWRDYPQVDYARLTYAAAANAAPLPVAEALRRVARADFATFAKEPAGALALTFVRSPGALLATLPKLYKMVLKGGTLHVAGKSETHVELEYRDYVGQADCYIVGQLEGMVQHYGMHPRLEVRMERFSHTFFRVSWSDKPAPDPGRRLVPAIPV